MVWPLTWPLWDTSEVTPSCPKAVPSCVMGQVCTHAQGMSWVFSASWLTLIYSLLVSGVLRWTEVHHTALLFLDCILHNKTGHIRKLRLHIRMCTNNVYASCGRQFFPWYHLKRFRPHYIYLSPWFDSSFGAWGHTIIVSSCISSTVWPTLSSYVCFPHYLPRLFFWFLPTYLGYFISSALVFCQSDPRRAVVSPRRA